MTDNPKPDPEKRLEVAADALETASAQLRELIKKVEQALSLSRGHHPPKEEQS